MTDSGLGQLPTSLTSPGIAGWSEFQGADSGNGTQTVMILGRGRVFRHRLAGVWLDWQWEDEASLGQFFMLGKKGDHNAPGAYLELTGGLFGRSISPHHLRTPL